MHFHFTGVIIAICTFLVIGIFHPIVVKTEYHFGTRPWWIFLVLGIGCVGIAICIQNVVVSSLLGVFGASLLWSIGELFSQKKRVEKGWFPMNPQRENEYQRTNANETLCPISHGKTIYMQHED